MKAVRCEAQITSVRTRTDNSLGLTIVTPELKAAEMLSLFELRGALLEMALFPKDTSADEVNFIGTKIENKSPSQRLREALFRLYQTQKPTKTFNDYYETQINKLIAAVESKVDGA